MEVARRLIRKWYVNTAVVIIAVALIVKWQSTLMPENVDIPMPKMPVPNARDYFNKAETHLRDIDAVSFAAGRRPKPPHGKNPDWNSNDHVFTLAEKQKLVAENQPAITSFYQGLNCQYLAPPARSFGALFPHESKDRALARLLHLKANVDAETGNWNAAMNDRLDIIQFGSDLARGATLGVTTGVACEEIGRGKQGGAVAVINRVTASEARWSAQRLAQIQSNQVPVSQTVREEAWCTEAGFLELIRTRRGDWRDIRELSDSAGDFMFTLPNVERNMAFLIESPRTIYGELKRSLDADVQWAGMTWPEQRRAGYPKASSDPACQWLMPVFDETVYKGLDDLALNRLLECELALRAYYLDHGAYPSALSDLVPTDIPAVPLDPFSDNQPLKYRRVGAKYLLYSVGPDAVDNGGSRLVDPAGWSSTYTAGQEANDRGDIVAGVNC